MSDLPRLLGLCGSLRKQSTNRGMLRCAARALIGKATLEIADLGDLPFFNADVEVQGKPESVQKLVDQAMQADALVIACNEYNYSMAPALKNALDWLSREKDNAVLAGKAVALMGAGGGMGSSRAQYHLRQTCVYLDLRPQTKPEVFANSFSDAFDIKGDVVNDMLTRQIEGLMGHLLQRLAEGKGWQTFVPK